ncbi:MAG: hypothetical protein IAE95_11420 [Chitinophagaceae bacterium]|nr:hypothetical protein [Chitinophagaceae bacterium]
MKLIASILIFSLLWLNVQPVVAQHLVAMDGKEACCGKMQSRHGEQKHEGGCERNDKGCCGSGMCNPLYSQCPVCLSVALTQDQVHFHIQYDDMGERERFFLTEDAVIAREGAELLHPPEVY